MRIPVWAAALLLLSVFACQEKTPQYNADGQAPSGEVSVPQSVQVKAKQDTPLLARPKDNAKTLDSVPIGMEMTADDVSGPFVRVVYNNRKGWVHTRNLMFREDGRAFLEQAAKKQQRRRAPRARSTTGALQQCGHVNASGRQCLYQTADDSGMCPEHQ